MYESDSGISTHVYERVSLNSTSRRYRSLQHQYYEPVESLSHSDTFDNGTLPQQPQSQRPRAHLSKQRVRPTLSASTPRGKVLRGQDFDLIPILATEDLPPLTWRPLFLKTPVLLSNAITNFAVAGGVLWLWYGLGKDRQAVIDNNFTLIAAAFAPSLIAVLSLLIFQSTRLQILRMLPYIRMADQNGIINPGVTATRSVGGCYFPFPFVTTKDEPRVKWPGQVSIVFLIAPMVAKSSLLSTVKEDAGWVVTIHRTVAYFVVATYCLLGIFYIITAKLLYNTSTGLKWEPASLFDDLALVVSTNALPRFSALTRSNDCSFTQLSRYSDNWRIGYWWRCFKKPDGTESHRHLVHGIGILEERPDQELSDPYQYRSRHCMDGFDVGSRFVCKGKQRCEVCQRLYPSFSRPGHLIAWIILLLIICVLVGIGSMYDALGSGVLLSGQWLTSTSSTSVSVVFRSIPTAIAYGTIVMLQTATLRMQTTQCWSDLAKAPQTSSRVLASEYTTMPLFLVPFEALRRGHYRLASVATVNILGPLFPPSISGLVILEQKGDNKMKLTCSKVAFTVVSILLVGFAVAGGLIRPRRDELLLRPMLSIADRIKPFACSKHLRLPAIYECNTLASRKTFLSSVSSAGQLYQLGLIEGACKYFHLGVDIVGDEHSGRDSSIKMNSASHLILAQDLHGPRAPDERTNEKITDLLVPGRFSPRYCPRAELRSEFPALHNWIKERIRAGPGYPHPPPHMPDSDFQPPLEFHERWPYRDCDEDNELGKRRLDVEGLLQNDRTLAIPWSYA